MKAEKNKVAITITTLTKDGAVVSSFEIKGKLTPLMRNCLFPSFIESLKDKEPIMKVSLMQKIINFISKVNSGYKFKKGGI
jgi:hypothetical protein